MLKLIKKDPYLKDYEQIIQRRQDKAVAKEAKLLQRADSLSDFANGHLYFGLHKTENGGFVFREWAPNAKQIFLIGEFTQWQKWDEFRLSPIGNGVWELAIAKYKIFHGQLYRLCIQWEGGTGDRIPAWARRVVQDEATLIFNAQVWDEPRAYKFKYDSNRADVKNPLIYEAHVGMATTERRVGTFAEFTKNILPKIKKAGYNTIQLMAIQEHPYYGSFGYHVSNFFAVSARFGTPTDLKILIDTAHKHGIMVIMDIVHSHAVKNQVEGIARFDGTEYQYFHQGARGEHIAWDSKCFDYDKKEVLHFLLSNIKFWLTEYHFDGFRFDGTTSMLYYDHGLARDFTDYSMYFDDSVDEDAVCYLKLANKLTHQINPNAITIAEEMSGYPGIAYPSEAGGVGFDYRLAMGVPDYWIKIIKEKTDETWSVGQIFHTLTNRRAEERVISYCESHDQALVGDKTIIFRLIDKDMYEAMSKTKQSLTVERGVALSKMIKLITLFTTNGGYLNFMGNEFGHPEWIDFPREGNNWSFQYARRQWKLAEDNLLRYSQLAAFDKAMVKLFKSNEQIGANEPFFVMANEGDQVVAFARGDFVFVFNFNPTQSFTDYGIPAKSGTYKICLNSDEAAFGGFDRIDNTIEYKTSEIDKNRHQIRLYLPSRCGLALRAMQN